MKSPRVSLHPSGIGEIRSHWKKVTHAPTPQAEEQARREHEKYVPTPPYPQYGVILFNYKDQYLIVRFMYAASESRAEWYKNVMVYDAAGISVVENENGQLRHFRPTGTDLPQFRSTQRLERYAALEAVHAAEDQSLIESARRQMLESGFFQSRPKAPKAPVVPSGTEENPAG